MVCAKSPEAVIDFVCRVSPATAVRSLNWDVVRDGDSTKGRRWRRASTATAQGPQLFGAPT
uniref:Uncharacterized protein n=1 Tax=Oryza meridionalis TaxID=40149 RepID=A0A0E0DP50_9ORYZ